MRTHWTFADTPLFGDTLLDTGIWPEAANVPSFRFVENGHLMEYRAEIRSNGRLEYPRMSVHRMVLPVYISPKSGS